MSHIYHSAPTPDTGKPFKYKGLGYWHVVCMFIFQSGCFFYLPPVEKNPNVAPVIEYSSPEPDDVLRIDTAHGSVAWVSVYDEDEGDVMEYLWTITGLGPQGTSQAFVTENYRGSSIQLSMDPIYSGRVLTCTVYDKAGASDRRSWTIEVENAP